MIVSHYWSILMKVSKALFSFGNVHLLSLNLDLLLFLPHSTPSSPVSFCSCHLAAPCSSRRTRCTVSDCAIELVSWSYWQMEFTLVIGGGHVAYASYVCTALHLANGLWTNARHRWHRGRGKGGAKGVQAGGKRKWAAMIFWRTPDWARSSMHYFNGWLAQKFRACLTCCCYSCCCCPTQF